MFRVRVFRVRVRVFRVKTFLSNSNMPSYFFKRKDPSFVHSFWTPCCFNMRRQLRNGTKPLRNRTQPLRNISFFWIYPLQNSTGDQHTTRNRPTRPTKTHDKILDKTHCKRQRQGAKDNNEKQKTTTTTTTTTTTSTTTTTTTTATKNINDHDNDHDQDIRQENE